MDLSEMLNTSLTNFAAPVEPGRFLAVYYWVESTDDGGDDFRLDTKEVMGLVVAPHSSAAAGRNAGPVDSYEVFPIVYTGSQFEVAKSEAVHALGDHADHIERPIYLGVDEARNFNRDKWIEEALADYTSRKTVANAARGG